MADTGDSPRGRIDDYFREAYHQLHGEARRQMAHERANRTIQATALVNELYLKLRNQRQFQPENREQFLRMAGHAMRQVLTDLGRRRRADKRAGIRADVDVDSLAQRYEAITGNRLQVREALGKLSAERPRGRRQAQLVQFWLSGMSFTEAAERLGVDRKTATRDWAYARAWLEHELNGRSPDPPARKAGAEGPSRG